MEERKFVCKYCNKRFPCGKSLGGHIRTHMTEERSNVAAAAADSYDHPKLLDGGKKRKRDSLWSEIGGVGSGGNNTTNLIYGLRENPKKTTRFVNIHDAATNTLAQQEGGKERFCKECGKGFPSLKALCGHMACHSEKEKGTNYRLERFEDRKLVMDDESDTENCNAPRRSKRRMRFKTLNLSDQPSSSSVPLGNNGSSSSVSEVEQSEEDVAMMLMMLSRDSRRKGGFASVTESSDNNSVVLEARKSSSPNTRIAVGNGKNVVPDDDDAYEVEEEKKLIKDLKLKSAAGNSDSGYLRYRLKTKKRDTSVSIDEFKGWNAKDKSSFDDYNVESESRKMMSRSKHTPDGIASKFDSRKRANYDSLVYGKKTNGFTNDEIHENYESLASEFNSSYDSTDESDEDSTDTDSFPATKSHNSKALNAKKYSKAKKKLKSKKSREHECPICYRIFRSGQALGGHKRSHFIGGGSGENTLVIKQGAPVVSCLIDLNLPAPVDD